MADVAGKQSLAVQCLTQSAQGGIEGHCQLADFIGGIVRGQGWGQAKQLIAVPDLTGQAHHRRHHLARQDPAEEHRQRQAQHEADQHHGKQYALAFLEIALVLQQHVMPAVDDFHHRVVRQLLAKHLVETRIQVPQVLG